MLSSVTAFILITFPQHVHRRRPHLIVAVLYPRDQLLEEKSCFIFTESASFDNSVKELTASRIFHHDSKVG
jgi:hypothetical protein